MCVPFQIKTRQMFRQLQQIQPRVTGEKKAIFVPHLFHILILQMTTHILVASRYCRTQSNRFSGQLARGAAAGSEPPPGHFQIQTEMENQGSAARAAKCASSSFCTVGWLLVAGLCRMLVLMQQRKKRFVFRAIYRQEWGLWHSSCSREIGDTLTFSQLSWPAA